METKIKSILERKVNPILSSHEGKASLVKIEGDRVTVKFDGACAGCPSAAITLEEIVATAIKEELPEINEVRLSQGVSDELIGLAKQILNKNK